MKENDKNKKKDEMFYELAGEVTKYGEFIPSFDAWITPDEQRARAEKLENPGKQSDS